MKLNYKRTILIGFAFMSILAFWQFYDQVIPFILEDRFGLNTVTTNAVMSIDNILALFMLPLFGMLSDKTSSRLGKRTPYILFGTIAASILLVLLALLEERHYFTGFMITLITLLVVISTYRSPAVAYMPDVTEKQLRSKGNAVINLIGIVSSGAVVHLQVGEILAIKQLQVFGGELYAPALADAADLLVELVVVVGQHAVSCHQRSFPCQFVDS